jgi:hypothetical protein
MSQCIYCFKKFNTWTLQKYNGYCGKCASALGMSNIISKSLREQVWIYNNGRKFDGNCFVCNKQINSYNFKCAHVISKYNRGTTDIKNLKPTCSLCNKLCGTRNLHDFKNTLQIPILRFDFGFSNAVLMEIEPKNNQLWD